MGIIILLWVYYIIYRPTQYFDYHRGMHSIQNDFTNQLISCFFYYNNNAYIYMLTYNAPIIIEDKKHDTQAFKVM
jgi:hypothetical protein